MCARRGVRVWVDTGVRGGLEEADPLTKTPHSISDVYEYMGTSPLNGRAEAVEKSSPEGRGVGWVGGDDGGISKMNVGSA